MDVSKEVTWMEGRKMDRKDAEAEKVCDTAILCKYLYIST